MQPMVPFTILRLAEVQGILPRKPKGGVHWKGKVKEGDRIEKVGRNNEIFYNKMLPNLIKMCGCSM